MYNILLQPNHKLHNQWSSVISWLAQLSTILKYMPLETVEMFVILYQNVQASY